MDNAEIRAVEQAMGAIRLIREKYASGEPGQHLTQEILQALRGDGKSLFRANMAAAIDSTLLNKSVEMVPLRAA